MVTTVRSPSRTITTREAELKILASPVATKKPQKARASGASAHVSRNETRIGTRFMEISLRSGKRPGGRAIPVVACAGESAVDERHQQRERGERPEQAVRPVEHEGHDPGAQGDQRREQHAAE